VKEKNDLAICYQSLLKKLHRWQSEGESNRSLANDQEPLILTTESIN
jgi:hypothetical protein